MVWDLVNCVNSDQQMGSGAGGNPAGTQFGRAIQSLAGIIPGQCFGLAQSLSLATGACSCRITGGTTTGLQPQP